MVFYYDRTCIVPDDQIHVIITKSNEYREYRFHQNIKILEIEDGVDIGIEEIKLFNLKNLKHLKLGVSNSYSIEGFDNLESVCIPNSNKIRINQLYINNPSLLYLICEFDTFEPNSIKLMHNIFIVTNMHSIKFNKKKFLKLFDNDTKFEYTKNKACIGVPYMTSTESIYQIKFFIKIYSKITGMELFLQKKLEILINHIENFESFLNKLNDIESNKYIFLTNELISYMNNIICILNVDKKNKKRNFYEKICNFFHDDDIKFEDALVNFKDDYNNKKISFLMNNVDSIIQEIIKYIEHNENDILIEQLNIISTYINNIKIGWSEFSEYFD